MVIGVDLNDVLRNFTTNFAKYYKNGYDHTFDYDEFEMWTHDLSALFPFKSDGAYNKFIYEDYAYELYAACPPSDTAMASVFGDWLNKIVGNIESEEPIEVIMVSPREYGLSIPSSMFFLSKIGCKARSVFFPLETKDIWDKCDAVITANPDILGLKPEGKISVRIEQEYNEDSDYDFTYSTFKKFASEKINTEKIVNYGK